MVHQEKREKIDYNQIFMIDMKRDKIKIKR